MKTILFASTNSGKRKTAQAVFKSHDIECHFADLEIDEIQGENAEVVARDKARKAFQLAGAPVMITDDSWSFSGLKGFPGAYMHSMNVWFTPQDFLHLTLPLKDRRVTMCQFLVYDNGKEQKIFKGEYPGRLLKEIRGESPHSSHTVIAMDGEGGRSIAEVHQSGQNRAERNVAQVWHEFAEWFAASPR